MDYNRFLSAPAPMMEGHSGYFSAPSDTLDPSLFEGDHLRSEVRNHVLALLTSWFLHNGFHRPLAWLHVWITGSAISYQWQADRGTGDLDVLFGVSMAPFLQHNPNWSGWTEEALATYVTTALKGTLWPKTANERLNGKTFEVTFYLNPNTGSDIVGGLHPYAAYDLIKDEWTVRPPELPQDPHTLYPKEWFDYTDRDTKAAQTVASRFTEAQGQLQSAAPGSPQWHNAGAQLNVVVATASSLFHELHKGRQDAFGGTGSGYADYHNFRWQRAKESGAVKALHGIMTVGEDAKKEEETRLYGQPIDPAEVALQRAALAHRQSPQNR